MALKSERKLIQERVDNRKSWKKKKEKILKVIKKEIGEIKLVEDMSKVMLKSHSFIQEKLDQARLNIANGTSIITKDYYSEVNGIEYCDVKQIINRDELSRHNNDPNIRLDECGFPEDRADRSFLLNKDFGDDLDYILNNIRSHWIYLHGDPGLGKTSLAIRSAWELIKDNPVEKATFLSVAKWTDSLKVGKEEYLPLSKLRRVVVIDDFDKFDQRKNFQIRQLLLLVEELKNRHLVVFTSNYSREEILSFNQNSMDLEVMLNRIKGKSIDFPRFTGKSYR